MGVSISKSSSQVSPEPHKQNSRPVFLITNLVVRRNDQNIDFTRVTLWPQRPLAVFTREWIWCLLRIRRAILEISQVLEQSRDVALCDSFLVFLLESTAFKVLRAGVWGSRTVIFTLIPKFVPSYPFLRVPNGAFRREFSFPSRRCLMCANCGCAVSPSYSSPQFFQEICWTYACLLWFHWKRRNTLKMYGRTCDFWLGGASGYSIVSLQTKQNYPEQLCLATVEWQRSLVGDEWNYIWV